MGWRIVLRHRVMVNLVTGTAIEGVLLRRSGALLVVADAVVHQASGESSRVDGQVVVERSRVEFVQTLSGG